MSVKCVVGSLWGDEGKGKIIDYLASSADLIIRAQGGNNAGHTIIIDDDKYALHLIPSGVIRPECINILGDGMVIDPVSFLDEIRTLNKKAVDTKNVFISDRANVVMPYHILIDKLMEKAREEKKIGTTIKGIGPSYTDSRARIGIRFCDFVGERNDEYIRESIELNYNYIEKIYGVKIDKEEMFNEMIKTADLIKPYIRDTVTIVHKALDEKKEILLEGAQGTLLDITYGTYPYVTSSHPISGGFTIGSGVPPNKIEEVYSIVKAYCTRVGAGPFVSEITGEKGDQIRIKGNEFGTTTGRPRRVGWLDAVALSYSCKINGYTNIALTLLDVLAGQEKLYICTAYSYRGEIIKGFPASIDILSECEAVYEELDGFMEEITDIKSYEDLPKQAKDYILRIEEILNVPVSIVSVGPDRKQTFIR